VINEFTLVDPGTGNPFVRPRGGRGEGDRDAAGPPTATSAPPTTAASPTSAPPTARPADITRRGRVSASTTYPGGQFPASLAVDGDVSTSWFSAGPGADGTSVYTWKGAGDVRITSVRIVSNGANADPTIRQNYGFGGVTVQILASGGRVVFEEGGTLPGTPDPTVTLEPNVVGSTVRLIYSEHEDAACGGFAELTVLGTA